jgi:xanthine dehydrogenase YagR molybdenum-binding subunit
MDRVDGPLKITGGAKYAADYAIEGMAYGIPVQSAIAKGRVIRVDEAAASKAPGVLAIITRANAPKLHQAANDFGTSTKLGESRPIFADDQIHYAGQYLALVVADSLERAIAAARLVHVEVVEERPAMTIESGERFQPPDDFAKTNYARGKAAEAFASAPHQGQPDVQHSRGAPQSRGTLGLYRGVGRRQAHAV